MSRPKKRFGQHFLSDQTVLRDIADAVPDIADSIVLEIGPGEGALTQFLLEKFGDRLWINEIDNDLIPLLQAKFPALTNRIVHQDFLDVDWALFPDKQIVIVGNFPYNISSQILFKVWDAIERVPAVVGMFQKEVAERVISGAGNKDYGILSVLLGMYFNGAKVLDVAPEAFRPPPKVWSTVIKLERFQTSVAGVKSAKFKEIVKLAFSQRRKMLRNSLKRYVTAIENNPETVHFLTMRPEQLTLADFTALTKTIFSE